MKEKHKTKILEWILVEPLFRRYLACWPNDIPLIWARIAWQAVVESGKAVYSSQDEELRVRSSAVALSLIYYEYCHRAAFHEKATFNYWSDDTFKSLRNDLSSNAAAIGDLAFEATRPLYEKIGDFETAAELWVNCVESSRGFPMSLKEKAENYRQFFEVSTNDFNYLAGQQFLLGGLDNLAGYVSISGLGLSDTV